MYKQVLFSLLRYEIKGEEISDNIKNELTDECIKELYSLADKHDVAHLVSDALLKNGLVDESCKIYKALERSRFLAIMRYEKLNLMLDEVSCLFGDNAIAHLPLKGSVLRDYYPEPWMRTSSDTDILIHLEDAEKAHLLLTEELGYSFDVETAYDRVYTSPDGMTLEVHFYTIEEDVVKTVDKVLDGIWQEALCVGNYRYALSDEMFYYYQLAHMAKHFVLGGSGLRSFIDVYILRWKFNFNEHKLIGFLKEGGIEEFEKEAVKLSEIWFDGGEYSPIDLKTEEYILCGGVYGNMENKVTVQQNLRGGKLKYFLSRVFVPYDDLKRLFPVLEKQKWLFPFMQVARWLRVIFKGRLGIAVQELSANGLVDKKKNCDTDEFLSALGLK